MHILFSFTYQLPTLGLGPLNGFFWLTWRLSWALNLASYVVSRTTEIQVCRPRGAGPGIPLKTTEENIDRVFYKHTSSSNEWSLIG